MFKTESAQDIQGIVIRLSEANEQHDSSRDRAWHKVVSRHRDAGGSRHPHNPRLHEVRGRAPFRPREPFSHHRDVLVVVRGDDVGRVRRGAPRRRRGRETRQALWHARADIFGDHHRGCTARGDHAARAEQPDARTRRDVRHINDRAQRHGGNGAPHRCAALLGAGVQPDRRTFLSRGHVGPVDRRARSAQIHRDGAQPGRGPRQGNLVHRHHRLVLRRLHFYPDDAARRVFCRPGNEVREELLPPIAQTDPFTRLPSGDARVDAGSRGGSVGVPGGDRRFRYRGYWPAGAVGRSADRCPRPCPPKGSPHFTQRWPTISNAP